MKLKVVLRHSSARKANRYTPYKEWVIPRLEYWTARVRNNAPVPKYDITLEKWIYEPIGATDKTNGEKKEPLIVPKRRIRLSPLKETFGLSLQSDNQATKSYTATEGSIFSRMSENESESECQTPIGNTLSERGSESDLYVKLWDEFIQALKDKSISKEDFETRESYTANEGSIFPRLSESESNSECQTPISYTLSKRSSESDLSAKIWDEFIQASKDMSISDCRSGKDDTETSHELEENFTDEDDHTVASSVEGADPGWWYPSDSTESSLNEFDRNYPTWLLLETSESQNSPNTSRGDSYISPDQSLGSAKNVLRTGPDTIDGPWKEAWREEMDQWYRMTRFINESETQGLVPTLQSQTYVSEWVSRTDLRHEGAGQNIDYTQPSSKSPREKPGLYARHRPYVRKTRNHREALAKAGRMDLNGVQFTDNF